MRWRSIARNRTHGLFFERHGSGWRWFEVVDGNDNGIRTAEVANGTDPSLSGPQSLRERPGALRLGFPDAGPYPRIPPRSGNIERLDDPVRFGRSDVVSFTAQGSSSSGTLYLTDGREELLRRPALRRHRSGAGLAVPSGDGRVGAVRGRSRMTAFRATDAFAVEAYRASSMLAGKSGSGGLIDAIRRAAIGSGGAVVAASASEAGGDRGAGSPPPRPYLADRGALLPLPGAQVSVCSTDGPTGR